VRTTFAAAVVAGLAGAVPSTLYALVTGGDGLASINAVAAIVNAEHLATGWRLAVAAAIHFAVSLLWATLLIAILPRRRAVLWAAAAGVLIAVLDLRVLAPPLFPEVAALAFWPQLADHVVWGVAVGVVCARTPSNS